MDQLLVEETYRNRLHIHYLKPYQELIVYQILENEDQKKQTNLLGCLPTGSGKSLCFMLPILLIPDAVFIVYPLLSLMADQARRFEEASVPYEIIRGGMSKEERETALRNLYTGTSKVCITNMEMLLVLKKHRTLEKFRGKTSMFVIDEAHTAITWGDSFRPCYQEIRSVISVLSPRHILAFTATMDHKIRDGILERVFAGKRPYIVHASSDRENIFYHALRSFSKMEDLVRILEDRKRRPAVVFCSSREETKTTAEYLSRQSFPVDFYNASLDKEARRRKEEWFFSSEEGVLCATSAYGMGVSKNNIRTIVHLSLPLDASSFLQESGRAGRDSLPAESFVLYSPDENSPLATIFKGNSCIRTSLLLQMNEHPEGDGCFSCSHCVPDTLFPKGEKEILSYFTLFPISTKEKAIARLQGIHVLSVFFHLRRWPTQALSQAIDYLREEKLLAQRGKWLKLTKEGRKKLSLIKGKN